MNATDPHRAIIRFVSTRGATPPTAIDDALIAGLAPDGGLYVPQTIPVLDAHTIDTRIGAGTLAESAAAVLAPYFAESRLREALPALCARAYDFDAPLRAMRSERAHGDDASSRLLKNDLPDRFSSRESGACPDSLATNQAPTRSLRRRSHPWLRQQAVFQQPASGDFLLELFHGPTAAFKDYAARFLAEALGALRADDAPTTTILVATSGDTGAAVAGAFHRRPGFEVVILYPDGRVSPRQAHGLECWGDNVRTFRVAGTFDDCQRMAKTALADTDLRAARSLTSANSISLGRLLPQVAYYAHTAAAFRRAHGEALNLIVPTGNLGNAAAAFLAKRMGLPIGEIVLATNANDVLPRYFDGGDYAPEATKATLANAMDVGAPSNFERLRHWHRDDAALRGALRALSLDDATIRAVIADAPARHGIVACPHTACGLHALHGLRQSGDSRPWAVVATAHPAKFETIVEPLVGHAVPPPPALVECLARPAHGETLAADDAALRARLIVDR